MSDACIGGQLGFQKHNGEAYQALKPEQRLGLLLAHALGPWLAAKSARGSRCVCKENNFVFSREMEKNIEVEDKV